MISSPHRKWPLNLNADWVLAMQRRRNFFNFQWLHLEAVIAGDQAAAPTPPRGFETRSGGGEKPPPEPDQC